MLNELIIGISQKLDSLYGDAYSIHTKGIPQKLKPPALFIQVLQTESEQIVGTRYFKINSFDIQFFPVQNGTELTQCQAVADQLTAELEYITITGASLLLFRGNKINTEIVDDVLHFFVQYNLFVRKVVAREEMMGEITQTDLIKG